MNRLAVLGRAGLESFALLAGAEEPRRNVRRVAVARLLSQAGSQAATVALLALIYERTGGSGVWLAAVFFSSFVVVRVFLGPWIGRSVTVSTGGR